MAEKTTGTKTRNRLLKARPSTAERQDALRVEKTVETAHPTQQPVTHPPRFQFFLIDSGWDGPAARVIRQNLRMVTQLQNHDPFYVLTRSQSSEILAKHPHLIGKDPILIARDLSGAYNDGRKQYHGFHLNLGTIKDPQAALDVLQKFVNFLVVHRKSADIDRLIKQQLHRDGLAGAVEVLRGGSESLI